MTNRDMIREVRKPGRIAVPVLAANEVTHLVVEKADLIAELEENPDAECAWAFYGEVRRGVRKLDVA